MRILITDKHYDGDIGLERAAAGEGAQFDVFSDGEEVTEEAWRNAEAILTFRCTPLVTARMGDLDRCQIIVRGGVGFDGLDLEGFARRGIAICNVPDYGTTEVADHAVALVLALRRGITSYHDGLRNDPAANWHYSQAPVVARLRGSRFGIVGLGRIGMAAARRANAFDCQVVFYDPFLAPGVDLATGFERANTLEELFASCDAISVHTPLTGATRRLINAELLDHAKVNAVLVNTSRGPVVDIDAVHTALKTRRLAAAGLDVLPDEPPVNHPLIRAYTDQDEWIRGRLILTPHSAFYSAPGQDDLRRKAIETISAYVRDGHLRNCVNADWLGS